MWKKLLMSGVAILIVLGANFDIACSFEGVEGVYSPFEADRCHTAAETAAAEISREDGGVTMPGCTYCLHPKGSGFDGEGLTDAILLTAPDVAVMDCVYVNGMYLGTVADSAELIDELRSTLGQMLPQGAVRAMYTQELDTKTCCGCVSTQLDVKEMSALINSLCPVVFTDAAGSRIYA